MWKNCGVLQMGKVLVEWLLPSLAVLISSSYWLSWGVVLLPAAHSVR
jgi:hypothetical protein